MSSPSSLTSKAPPLSAPERAWAWGAVMVGAWLRLAFPGRMAVEHFDEAVYASNVLFGPESGYQYPNREFFAPPLLPAAIEWLTIAWSPTGVEAPTWLPMVPALICGIATVPSLWWVARRWFGPNAAIAAAWMVALCEFHAAYSRTALTDVPLSLGILWAVYWFGEALRTGSLRAAALAGTITALAWWTKYNGWLPLAIGVTASGLVLIALRASLVQWRRAAAACAAVIATALVLWLPALWDCQDVGGYAAVAANHRGYVTGWLHWFENAGFQFYDVSGQYAGWLTVLGIGGPSLIAAVLDRRTVAGGWLDGRLTAVLVNVVVLLFVPTAWIRLALAVAVLCSVLAFCRGVRDRGESLVWAAALVLVWVGSLLVVTPLYQPYPRLLIPLIVAALLGASMFWRPGCVDFASPATNRRAWLGPALLIATAIVLSGFGSSRVWEDRTGYRSAAVALKRCSAVTSSDPRGSAIVFVVDDPALFYHLRNVGVPAAMSANYGLTARPQSDFVTFLATGPLRYFQPDSKWDSVHEQFTLVAEVGMATPSRIVFLDQNRMGKTGPAYGSPLPVSVYRLNSPSR